MENDSISQLKELLREYLGSDFEIKSEKVKPLTAPGENYGSLILALELTVLKENQEQTLYAVAKLPPRSEILKEAFETTITFKKEIIAYTKIIPALIQLQLDYELPEKYLVDIFPKCYGARINLTKNKSEVDDDAVLLFENLKIQGYEVYDRLIGFDLDTAKIILKDLAKFHSVTIAMRLLKPSAYEKLVGFCLTRNKGMDDAPKEVNESFRYSVVNISETIPEIAKYVERIAKAYDESKKYYDSDKEPRKQWGTVVHGDYWVNNTMLKKNIDGKAVKNKIIDLQVLEYNSAVTDLIFFLFTSVMDQVLENHYGELLKTYHTTFFDIIKAFRIDESLYTWKEFLKEIEIEAPKEFYHVSFMLKFILGEKGTITNMDDFQVDDFIRNDLLGANHRRKLKATVLQYIKRNWI